MANLTHSAVPCSHTTIRPPFSPFRPPFSVCGSEQKDGLKASAMPSTMPQRVSGGPPIAPGTQDPILWSCRRAFDFRKTTSTNLNSYSRSACRRQCEIDELLGDPWSVRSASRT